MDDKLLAERVAELGVIRVVVGGQGDRYYNMEVMEELKFASEIVKDPRVAMALMEQCEFIEVFQWSDGDWNVTTTENVVGDSLPRAIIEAAVMALEAK